MTLKLGRRSQVSIIPSKEFKCVDLIALIYLLRDMEKKVDHIKTTSTGPHVASVFFSTLIKC